MAAPFLDIRRRKMEVVKLYKKYGKKNVLENITFQIEKGKCIGFIGANGCGKSTLFRILAGVEKADSGKILVDEKGYGKIGYVPQENAFLEELTVADNIDLFAALGSKKADADYRKELCSRFSIQKFEKERINRLSGGMKKRVSIVCALLHQPEILILDEPSAALDLIFKEELKACIKEFTNEGGSVLLSSHDQGEIMCCDRLFALKNSGITQVEPPFRMNEIIERYIK